MTDPRTSPPPGGVTTLAILLGALFGAAGLGSTAMAVVLPDAGRALEIEAADTTWFISSYVLTMAVSTPLYGRLVDVYGPRLPLLIGVMLMSLGALVAAVAQSFTAMLAARALQGLGAGVGATLAVAIIGARFAQRDQARGLAIVAGMAAAIGSAGPVIGGGVDWLFGWRAVAALPSLCLVVMLMLWSRVAGGGEARSFDVLGALFVSLLSGGVIMVIQSPANGAVLAAVGACFAFLGGPLVVRRSRRATDPFLPVVILQNRGLWSVCLIAGTIPAAWFAMLVAAPAWLATSGWTALQIGALLAPTTLVAVAAPRFTVPLGVRIGPQRSLAVAAVLCCVSVAVGAMATTAEIVPLIPVALAVVGVGFSIGQPALFTLVNALVDRETRGLASGFATLVFLCCGSAGAAVIGGLQPRWGFEGGLAVLAGVLAVGALCALARIRREE